MKKNTQSQTGYLKRLRKNCKYKQNKKQGKIIMDSEKKSATANFNLRPKTQPR